VIIVFAALISLQPQPQCPNPTSEMQPLLQILRLDLLLGIDAGEERPFSKSNTILLDAAPANITCSTPYITLECKAGRTILHVSELYSSPPIRVIGRSKPNQRCTSICVKTMRLYSSTFPSPAVEASFISGWLASALLIFLHIFNLVDCQKHGKRTAKFSTFRSSIEPSE